MNARTPTKKKFLALITVLVLVGTAAPNFGQSDLHRDTIAVTYPLGETINVRFRGTTRLPRLKGEAKVRREGRRGTRVQLSVDNLPRAYELGSVYTTYVLWAVSPEGRIDNLGELRRSGGIFNLFSSKLDVTTPLQTFALLVTAEPHFLVPGPSRMVVLENLPPRRPGGADISTVSVRYLGNSSDYFNDPRVPDVADADYRKMPTSLMGARQAVNLARYNGAEAEAPEELRAATEQLEAAENGWRLRQSEAEVDASARQAISLAVKAEEMAGSRRAARLRREEIAKRDRAIREAEENTLSAEQRIADLREELARERRARELAERDLANTTDQLRDFRAEVARLREELQSVRAEGEDAKLRLARIEGERQAEEARRTAEQRATEARAAEAALKQALGRFGAVRETERGIVLVLPESFWSNPRRASLTPAGTARLEQIAALLANNPNYQILVESYTDNQGAASSLLQLTSERARLLAEHLVLAGIENDRIRASGLGSSNPQSRNNTAAGRARNRRVEITLVSTSGESTALTRDD